MNEPIAEGRTAEVFVWRDEAQVLKLFKAGCSRSTVDDEFRIARAAYEAGIAAPQPFERVEVEGRYGIVYARVTGPTMLMQIQAQPDQAAQFGRQMAEVHFALNQKHTTQLVPQRARMRRLIGRVQTLSEAEKDAVFRKLDALPDDDAVCHGDFHPDNIVLTADGLRVIDWNNATYGNAAADVCWTLIVLEFGGLPGEDTVEGRQQRAQQMKIRLPLRDAYLARYTELMPSLPAQWPAWYPIVAAVRLSDGIAGEQATLLDIVRRG